MIRILHVMGSLNRGGTEAYVMNIYRNIDRSKIQFDFLILYKNDYPYLKEIAELGGRVYFGVPFSKKNPSAFLNNCVTLMKQNSYDAVHSHLNSFNGWVMLAAKRAGVPKRISHSHDTYGKDGSFLHKLYFDFERILIKKCATEFLACSLDAGEYLYGAKTFRSVGRVINNGIDVDAYLKQPVMPEDIDVDELGSVVFGNVSRFEAKKNQLFLLDVFREILMYEPKATLLLGGGDGGQLSECKQKVEELGISDRVKFIGVRKDMPRVLSLIDVFIFPSLYEGLGIVLLEAQAAGCYCVASDACPKDTDMGLERMDYIPLTDNASVWARRIVEGYNRANGICVDADTIRGAFDAKKYSVSYLVKCMTDIYIGEKCE